MKSRIHKECLGVTGNCWVESEMSEVIEDMLRGIGMAFDLVLRVSRDVRECPGRNDGAVRDDDLPSFKTSHWSTRRSPTQ